MEEHKGKRIHTHLRSLNRSILKPDTIPQLFERRSRKNVFIAIGLAVVFLLLHHMSTAQPSPPFSLLVTLVFSAVEHKDAFLEDFAPLAAYVRDHEPTTIAYEALQSDQNPLQVMILERYRDKEVAFLQIHKSSKQFLDFRPKLKMMQENGHVVIDGHSYVDSGLGFGNRASTK